MTEQNAGSPGGLAGWLLSRWQNRSPRKQPRLVLIERINLAPRQTLSLVEAEGRRFLVASSPDGAPSFYPLDGRNSAAAKRAGRISW